MNAKLKLLMFAAVLVLVVAGAALLYNILAKEPGRLEEMSDTPPVSDAVPAPDFAAENYDGNAVSLSDFAGSPVVLNFWASWCPPCRSEMPHFETLYAEYGGTVVFMMVDLTDGRRETKSLAAEYVDENGFTFPVYYDTKGDAATAYEISAIPVTVFISGDGSVYKKFVGGLDEKTIREYIEKIAG